MRVHPDAPQSTHATDGGCVHSAGASSPPSPSAPAAQKRVSFCWMVVFIDHQGKITRQKVDKKEGNLIYMLLILRAAHN